MSTFQEHVRAYAAQATAAVQVDALRDAADDFDTHRCDASGAPGLRLPCEHTLNPAAWLRARADLIEQEHTP